MSSYPGGRPDWLYENFRWWDRWLPRISVLLVALLGAFVLVHGLLTK